MPGKLSYNRLLPETEERIQHNRMHGTLSRYRCRDEDAVRRNPDRDKNTVLRPSFSRDIDKILHLPLYNRYNDKTQVFSLYANDDITRRGLHVQLVSRISRNICGMLGLNCDLAEAIALGHDVGHAPFGHAGERFLSELLEAETGRFFSHNAHSVRVLDRLYRRNISLQTLDGILCHNGEFEMKEYRPAPLSGFEEFDERVENCALRGADAISSLVPSTLEGCVVRICDMIAYIGKDRQDAVTAGLLKDDSIFSSRIIGSRNAEMINNLTVDIVNNSFGRDCIRMSGEAYRDLKTAKKENYRYIYNAPPLKDQYDKIRPMFSDMFYRLLDDIKKNDTGSIVYKHHIQPLREARRYYGNEDCPKEDPRRVAVDFIASMTDDYFIELYKLLFPYKKPDINYRGYFRTQSAAGH